MCNSLERVVFLALLLGLALPQGVVASRRSPGPVSAPDKPVTADTIPRASAHLDEHSSHQHHDGHECGHSKVSHLQEESVQQFRAYAESKGLLPPLPRRAATRSLAQSGSRANSIRMNVQYQLTSMSGSQQQAVQRVVDTAVRVVRKFVEVTDPLRGPLQVRSAATCQPAQIPATARAGPGRGLRDTDFLLLVTSQQASNCPSGGGSTTNASSAGTLAWAMACDYSLDPASFSRPIMGVINLCAGAVRAASDAASAAGTSGYITGSVVDVLVHELMHALGLSSASYSSWSDAQGQEHPSGGRSGTYLTTPRVKQAARQLLQCDRLPGAPLEDEGNSRSSLSHWEYRFFSQEMMTPLFGQFGQRLRMSTLTLAALQDTGWYNPRMQFAQSLDLAQLPPGLLGCNLAMSSCQAFQSQSPGAYYCTASAPYNSAIPVQGAGGPGSAPPLMQQTMLQPLQCFSPTTPVTCETSPFSNGCGVLRPNPVSCSSTNFASFIPRSTPNLMAGMAGVSPNASFYQALGKYYGASGYCLPWSNGTGTRFAGCFYVPGCNASRTPLVTAMVSGALVSIPCPAGTTVLMSGYIPVRDPGAALTCPTVSQALQLCNPDPPGTCGYAPCVHGTCSPSNKCVCDLEYMGSDCSLHVSQVNDFDRAIASVGFGALLAVSARPIDQPLSGTSAGTQGFTGSGDCHPSSGLLCQPSNVQVPLRHA